MRPSRTRRAVEPSWLEPYADSALPDPAPGPEARYEQREAIQLSFIVALQQLPAKQRAALVLRDVLGFHTDEAASILETTPQSVKAALQRARATLDSYTLEREPAPLPDSPTARCPAASAFPNTSSRERMHSTGRKPDGSRCGCAQASKRSRLS